MRHRQHAAHVAPALPNLTWLPTDLTDESFDSVVHHTRGLENVLEPGVLVRSDDANWPDRFHGSWEPPVAVLAVNLTHISPWEATVGAVRGSAKLLEDTTNGLLMIYGPFKRGGEHTSEGNATFDASLRAELGVGVQGRRGGGRVGFGARVRDGGGARDAGEQLHADNAQAGEDRAGGVGRAASVV